METQSLLEVLKKVKPFVKHQGEMSQVFFLPDGVYVLNDLCFIYLPFDHSFQFTIAFDSLYRAILGINETEISFDYDEEKQCLNIEGNHIQLNLACINSPSMIFKTVIDIDSYIHHLQFHHFKEEFLEGLEIAEKGIVSGDFYSLGILGCVKVGKEELLSSDNHCAILYQFKEQLPVADFFIPGKLIKEIVKGEYSSITKDSHWVYFTNLRNEILGVRLHFGEFPPLRQMFLISTEKFFLINTKKLEEEISSFEFLEGEDGQLLLEYKDGQYNLVIKGEKGIVKSFWEEKSNSGEFYFSTSAKLLLKLVSLTDKVKLYIDSERLQAIGCWGQGQFLFGLQEVNCV